MTFDFWPRFGGVLFIEAGMPRCWWCSYELYDGESHPQCRGMVDGIDVWRPPLAEDEPLPVPVWGKYVEPE